MSDFAASALIGLYTYQAAASAGWTCPQFAWQPYGRSQLSDAEMRMLCGETAGTCFRNTSSAGDLSGGNRALIISTPRTP